MNGTTNSRTNDPRGIPPLKMLWILIGSSLLLQFVIISYNHISATIIIHSGVEFFLRLLVGSLLTSVGFACVVYPDLAVINILNRNFPWSGKYFSRVIIELLSVILLAFFGSSVITVISHLIHAYEKGLSYNLVNNGLIAVIVNILVVICLEAWIFFRESRISREKAAALEKELTGIRFEVLKNQINPHFMFNSLNVLSGLINKDPEKAQQFIDEFSMIYRYVLETIDQKVTLLQHELDFIRSYLILQQIRYGDCLEYGIDLDSTLLQLYLPPLSLQTVVENAIKHNVISDSSPLRIRITGEKDHLMIRNNLQPKMATAKKTGIGQANLAKRYAILGTGLPSFRIVDNEYVVILPLITTI